MLAALSCCLAIAQNVTMRYSDVKISTVLEEIERQTDYQFAYSATLVDVSQRTSVDVQNATVAATLSKALAGKGIGYRIVDKQVSLYKVDQAPKGRVAGSILDAKGDPVPGAFVLIEGTTNGVVADANGRYSIEAPAGANLVISCLGFEDLVVPASHAGDIILKESSTFLDEAVMQGNCLAGYIGRFTEGNCLILFMRRKKTPELSYITVEIVNGEAVQAKLAGNREVSEEEQHIITEWVEKCSRMKGRKGEKAEAS